VIDLPRGSYVPVFHRRAAAPPREEGERAEGRIAAAIAALSDDQVTLQAINGRLRQALHQIETMAAEIEAARTILRRSNAQSPPWYRWLRLPLPGVAATNRAVPADGIRTADGGQARKIQ
jgi:hypothetical protein